jgi:hypothetical protein
MLGKSTIISYKLVTVYLHVCEDIVERKSAMESHGKETTRSTQEDTVNLNTVKYTHCRKQSNKRQGNVKHCTFSLSLAFIYLSCFLFLVDFEPQV